MKETIIDYGNFAESDITFNEAKDNFFKGRDEFITYLQNEASEAQLLAYLGSVNKSVKDLSGLPEDYRSVLMRIEKTPQPVMIRSYKLFGVKKEELLALINQIILRRVAKGKS